MADDVTVDNGALADYDVSADDCGGKFAQRVKLAYSADGVATHVPADADGLLVNLGANNDVTVTGTVTVDTELTLFDLDSGGGTVNGAGVALLAAGAGGPVVITGDVANGLDVDITRLPALVAGSAAIGKLAANDGVDIGDVTINNAAGASAVNIQDGGNTITVDGTVTVNVAAGTNNIGDVDVLTLPALVAGSANIGDVDVLTLPGITGAAANDAAVSGNPVLVAGRSSAAAPTDVAADGRAVSAWHLRNGAQATVITAAGALVGGDAANGLDVDVTRLPALVAGTAAIGKLAANSGVDIGDVDVTSISAGTNTIGDVGIKPRTSGGFSIVTDIDLDETETAVKATAGQLFGWYIYNDGAAEVYVKLYNDTVANVVVGTTVPVMTLGIPAGSAANVFNETGIAFSAAITAAATTVATTADATAPAANQVVANFFYA